MQLASIPAKIMSANQQVLGSLQHAHAMTSLIQATVEKSGKAGPDIATGLSVALGSARQAVEGVEALGAGNLLDGTFQRQATHSVRHLEHATRLFDDEGRLDPDSLNSFTRAIFDAEVSTRMGSMAGVRSLEHPSPKAIERASEAGSPGSNLGDATWVDGQWLDSIGNPVRGSGDSWTGHDGVSYGSDGGVHAGDGGGRDYDSVTGPTPDF